MVITPLVAGIIGFVIGAVIASIIFFVWDTAGTLHIDRTHSDHDIYRLEIDDLDILDETKRIVLKIDHDADLSQK